MEIDRRVFLASVGGLAVVEAMDDEAKAEALEHYMMDVLDGGHGHEAEGLIIGGEAQVVAAPPDATIRRGAGSLFATQGPAESRKMAELAPMSAKPTLLEFYEKRFAPANHVLQSATRAMKTGMSEEIILACLLHDVVLNLMKVDHGWWGAQMLEPYVPERTSWAIRYHQALRFYPDSANGYEYPGALHAHLREGLRAAAAHQGGLRVRAQAQVVHGRAHGHRQRPLRVRPERQGLARAVHRHHRPPLQAAEGGPGQRQQPDGPHVADDDVPG